MGCLQICVPSHTSQACAAMVASLAHGKNMTQRAACKDWHRGSNKIDEAKHLQDGEFSGPQRQGWEQDKAHQETDSRSNIASREDKHPIPSAHCRQLATAPGSTGATSIWLLSNSRIMLL